MKKIVTTVLAFVMLLTSVICFVGCKEKEEPIDVSILVYEKSNPYVYIYEFTEENDYYEITIPYDTLKRHYYSTIKFPDGSIKEKIDDVSITSFTDHDYLPREYLENWENWYKNVHYEVWDDVRSFWDVGENGKGIYRMTFNAGNGMVKFNFKEYRVDFIVKIV